MSDALLMCPACDNMILPGTTACPYCGAKLDADGNLIGQTQKIKFSDEASGIIAQNTLQEKFAAARLPEDVPARTQYAEPEEFQPFKLTEQLKPSGVVEVRRVADPVPISVVPLGTGTRRNEGDDFWTGVLGFFIPPVGFIMWILMHATAPQRAKTALIGAVLGTFILGFGGCVF